MATKTLTKPASNEINLTRVYDAPVKIVWDAWTDPEQAKNWWGPRGFTLTTHKKDFREGGTWNYTMHGPDGKDWPNIATYHVIEKYKKMVYDHGATGDAPPLFRVTVLFSESNGKTTIDMTMTLATADAAANTREFIKKAGGNATWDRLGEYLEENAGGKRVFIINRSFNAPLDVVYDMWTKPEHFSKWLPPTGFTMEFLGVADIRSGGSAKYKMTNGQVTMYGRVDYERIEKPELVYSQMFLDEKGNISRHPMAPVWPESMKTHVVLIAEGEDQTRVTVTWEPCATATPAEVEVFAKARGGMTQGWTGSFDKLEALLAAM